LQLAADAEASKHHFAGSIEEVDTGRELRFKSTEELLAFLAQCFVEVTKKEEISEKPLPE